jgi:hypothetical protein
MTDLIYRGIKLSTAKTAEAKAKAGLMYRGIPYLKTVRSTQPGNRVFLYRGAKWVG